MNNRIVCAACRHTDGRIAVGPRHFDHIMWSQLLGADPEKFHAMMEATKGQDPPKVVLGWQDATEGFIDQHGRFYTREEAWIVADAEGQIIVTEREWMTGRLHSEHLY